MEGRFRGTRDSIAKPGLDAVRDGGNTSCVEVRSAAGTLVVLHCGTGPHGLGQALVSAPPQPIRGSLLVSHTLWDHIRGLPFFAPLRVPANRWDIYAPHGLSQCQRETVAGQMQSTFSPITLEEVGATIRYHDLVGGVFDIDDIWVRTRYLNHPALTLGYRLEADGVSVVYACDHECVLRQPVAGDSELLGREHGQVAFLEGADLVIHDAQSTAAEYANRIGWGRSTADYAVAVCPAAGLKRLALSHHDPMTSDPRVDDILAGTRTAVQAAGQVLEMCVAAEGQTIDLDAVSVRKAPSGRTAFSAVTAIECAVEGHSVLIGALRPAAAAVIRVAAQVENLPLVAETGIEETGPNADADRPSLLVPDADATPEQTGAICRTLRENARGQRPRVPIVVIADRDDAASPSPTWPPIGLSGRLPRNMQFLKRNCISPATVERRKCHPSSGRAQGGLGRNVSTR